MMQKRMLPYGCYLKTINLCDCIESVLFMPLLQPHGRNTFQNWLLRQSSWKARECGMPQAIAAAHPIALQSCHVALLRPASSQILHSIASTSNAWQFSTLIYRSWLLLWPVRVDSKFLCIIQLVSTGLLWCHPPGQSTSGVTSPHMACKNGKETKHGHRWFLLALRGEPARSCHILSKNFCTVQIEPKLIHLHSYPFLCQTCLAALPICHFDPICPLCLIEVGP